MPHPELLVDKSQQTQDFSLSEFRHFQVEGAGQMQRFHLVHPGEGDMIVAGAAADSNGDLVITGALKAPVIEGGDRFNDDYRERLLR